MVIYQSITTVLESVKFADGWMDSTLMPRISADLARVEAATNVVCFEGWLARLAGRLDTYMEWMEWKDGWMDAKLAVCLVGGWFSWSFV